MSAGLLLVAEAKRAVALTLRYPAELLFSMVLTLLLFSGLVAGAAALGAPAAAGVAPLAAGYLAWMVVAGAVVGMAFEVQSESQSGTLENLCAARFRLDEVLLARAAVGCVHALAVVAVVGAPIVAFTEGPWRLSWSLLPFAAAAMLGATGIGLALAGVALLWKRVGYLLVAVQAVMLPLALAVPAGAGGASRGGESLVPIAAALRCLKAALLGPACSVVAELPIALAGAAIWLLAGWAALRALLAAAQQAGCLAER
jgi:ABC-2 type transport system permease protein